MASRLAAKIGNCRQRRRERHNKWMIDRDWRRWDNRNLAVHHRILTPEVEAAIKDFIVTNHAIPWVLFTGDAFREVAAPAFLEKHSDIDTSVPFFDAVAGSIDGFKLQNWLGSRSCDLKRSRFLVSVEIKSLWR
jgi:hypothetical protein